MKRGILIVLVIILFTGCGRTDNVNVENPNIIEVTGKGEKVTADLNNSGTDELYERGPDGLDKPNNADDKTQDFSSIIEKKLRELKRDDFKCEDSLLNMYKDILISEVSFNDENGYTELKNVYLNEMKVEDIPLEYYMFSLIDMNQDQIPELVLEVSVGGGADFVLAFHLQNGEIYCHWYSNRQVQLIKVDGTYRSSGGAGAFYICQEELDKSKNTTRYLASHEYAGADKNNQAIYKYFINEKEVDKEEFDAFMDAFDNKEDAVWCVFPNQLSGQNIKEMH